MKHVIYTALQKGPRCTEHVVIWVKMVAINELLYYHTDMETKTKQKQHLTAAGAAKKSYTHGPLTLYEKRRK